MKEEQSSTDVKLPKSKKIYIETNGNALNEGGHSLRVPFREIKLTPTRDQDDLLEENPPVRVYDASGIWTDPDEKCDVTEGLPALRSDWITARGDVEEYEGREVKPQDNGYLTEGAEGIAREKAEGRLKEFPALKRPPLRAKSGRNVTQM
ncbi:MAG: phosphomethylpyrimidine synthase, partial [Pyrinomonadaceae bacterium]|nr:phosphomethylpyrimidine synthase [Pyrinomonadaceae bacterium]